MRCFVVCNDDAWTIDRADADDVAEKTRGHLFKSKLHIVIGFKPIYKYIAWLVIFISLLFLLFAHMNMG